MATTAVTFLPTPLPEASDYIYAPTEPLSYSDGTPVLTGHVSAFTATIINSDTGTTVRASTPVLTAVPTGMGGTLSAAGMLRIPLTDGDTLASGTARLQRRRLVLQLTTTTGYRLNWAVIYVIDNDPVVTS